ncbi:MAG TPA: sigma 54-interacting transcriptional regulator, partial [Kofleriaceae bacterium]|nr:sigma 54-interacting transcriptional regulator [Kofleriaceae bacterium]
MTDRHTRTADDGADGADTPGQPYLIRALAYDRPTVAPARWSLSDVSEITLSGAGPASAMRVGHLLAISCDDAWASTRHATIRASFGRWVLEDLGSKNGTFVDGERVTRHVLDDGDLIEIGHTALWFRELATAMPARDTSVDLVQPFMTLHAPLEADLGRAIDAVTAQVPVLVTGETGSGKERFVAALHARCHRPGALVAVSCASLPPSLVEAELFGHRKGAFSGASEERTGYIRAADRGTLFLDEIGDMPATAQTALLRVLAERAVTPVGDETPIPVDVAIVSATHRDLATRAATGEFRADLLARIRGVTITIPPLRERREDIGMFVSRALARVDPAARLSPEAARRLLLAPWPLNVRELDNTVVVAALRAKGRAIAVADLDTVPAIAPPPPAMVLSGDDAELRDRLVAALA